MKIVPQRELRNRIGSVLREVEAGERIRITLAGRPVADLVPITGVRRTFVPKDDVVALLRRSPVDPNFTRDLQAVNATIDEL